jgi:hypothetical protein
MREVAPDSFLGQSVGARRVDERDAEIEGAAEEASNLVLAETLVAKLARA